MRPTFWFSLVALCVVASLVRSSATRAEGRATPAPAAAKGAARQVAFSDKVQGKGNTPEEARASAVDRARYVIAAYLESEYGEANYTPTAAYLHDAQIVPP